ncbi:MAG TPA: hypothetical protein PKG48_06740 [Bacteroidales bacterium]|nr:hypothetical protein [Bacteroidales bacterium]HPS62361.1 hypothetical protein [Bacteroidales bacterium]
MTDLERFILENRDGFDSAEPEPAHFRRFEERLEALQPRRTLTARRSLILKVAAAVLLIITVGALAYDLSTGSIRSGFALAGQRDDMPQEIREAVQYYDGRAATKVEDLARLTAGRKDAGEAGNVAEGELRSLDAATRELRRSLEADPGNERILDAIVRNQQMKEAVLNTLIDRISSTRSK